MKKNYYIFSDTLLRRRNNTLYFDTIETDDDEEELCSRKVRFKKSPSNRIVPIETVDSIFAYGQIYFNTKLLNYLSEYLIPLHLFNNSGNYSGSYYPKDFTFKKNIYLKQAMSVKDKEIRSGIIKEIAIAFAENIKEEYIEMYHKGFKVNDYININNDLSSEIEASENEDEIKRKVSDIDFFFKDSWFDIFKYRYGINKKIDLKIKTVFSFISMMLKSTCLTEIYKCGMNPALSFFHDEVNKSNSLCKDISMLFKPRVCSELILGMLKAGEIEFRSFITNKSFCTLDQDTIKKLVLKYDRTLNSEFCSTEESDDNNIHNLIRAECRKIFNNISTGERYIAYRA